jgi:hypothetical protein
MRKIDILYDNLINLLSQITYENGDFTLYHDAKSLALQEELVGVVDSILTEKREIAKSKMRLEFYPDFQSLISHLDNFKNSFNDFPGFRKNEIYGIITLIQKLTIEYGGAGIDLEELINENEFDLLELNHDLNKNNFFVFDSLNYQNSLFLFNLSNKQEFKTYVDDISAGANILFYLLARIGRTAIPLTAAKYVLVNANFVSRPKTVWATLCLHIVKSGETIHRPYEYNSLPQFSPNSNIILGNTYQQFVDSLDIISEYNFQKDILDKYLRIYHVFENFMYKAPLVNLERQANGEVFSIRDFKRMYDKIKDSEIAMLKKLFDEILLVEYSPGTPYSTKILADWTAIIPAYFTDDTNINVLLKKLNVVTNKGVDITHNYVNNQTISYFFSKLVYCYRNSIVHNRETEFHLTHLNLLNHQIMLDTAKVILEKFLIPTLEEIVFSLIILQNDIVWYDQSKLTLWEET